MKASCSMFSQILKRVPHTDFERLVRGLVKQTSAERAADSAVAAHTRRQATKKPDTGEDSLPVECQ